MKFMLKRHLYYYHYYYIWPSVVLFYSALTSGKPLLLMPSLPLRYIFYCMSLLSTFIEKYTALPVYFTRWYNSNAIDMFPFMIKMQKKLEFVETQVQGEKTVSFVFKGEKITISGCIWYIFPSPLLCMLLILQNVVNH